MWFVTNGDILMRFPYDISCFLAVVRFLYEISFFWLRNLEDEGEGEGVDGIYICREGAIIVGCE